MCRFGDRRTVTFEHLTVARSADDERSDSGSDRRAREKDFDPEMTTTRRHSVIVNSQGHTKERTHTHTHWHSAEASCSSARLIGCFFTLPYLQASYRRVGAQRSCPAPQCFPESRHRISGKAACIHAPCGHGARLISRGVGGRHRRSRSYFASPGGVSSFVRCPCAVPSQRWQAASCHSYPCPLGRRRHRGAP